MTTPCTHFRDDLKAYADGELRGLLRLRVKRHVAHCSACREEIEAMELIRRRLRQNDPNTFTPELKSKILSGIPDGAPPVGEAVPLRKPRLPLVLFGATSAAVLSWFLFYPMMNKQFEPQSESSVAANTKSVGTGMMMYSQDYDQVAAGGASVSSATEDASKSAPRVANEMANAPMATMDGKDGSGIGGGEGFGGRGLGSGASVSGKRMDAEKSRAVASMPAHEALAAPDKLALGKSKPELDSAAYATLDRQVHREASLGVQVDSAEAKSNTVETMTKTEGGYVADSSLQTLDDGTKTATMTLKIPVDRFEPFLAALGKLGEVKSKNVSGEDLTERISDEKQTKRVLGEEIEETQARLRQKKQTKLQEKDDREALRELKTRIAIKEARLQMYKKMATLSTISLTLSEKSKTPPVEPPKTGFFHDLQNSASDAGQTFLQAAKLPFILLIWIAVYAPVWLLLLAGYRYFVRA